MIHAIPGMGGDHRMYQGAWLTLPNFIAHDWPAYRGEKTLAAVADSMCEARDIRDGDILVGSSLGGMVACEITKLRNISRLFLAGSAIERNEVSHLLSVLHPLMQFVPIESMKLAAARIHSDIFQMLAGSDASFIRAMCDAIFEWQGLGTTLTPVYRIHGVHDWVIPLPEKAGLVLDGGHLIAMTHAKECVEYVLTLI
ncbi:MAG: alpha/beta hydrolase [Steroidobacter sp.]